MKRGGSNPVEPASEFFRKLGLLVIPNFLEAKFCADVCREMRDAASEQGRVVAPRKLNHSIRKVSCAHIAAATSEVVESKLQQLQTRMEEHFAVSITGIDGPQFLLYKAGDFYQAHADASPGAPPHILQRQVSVVIFLNAATEDPAIENGYGGGALSFSGFLGSPVWQRPAVPVEGSPGLLVAFLPDIIHEVTPVTFGQRCPIAAWFIGDSGSGSTEFS